MSLIDNECERPKGVLHSFSIKNIFYNKMVLRFFNFHVRIYEPLIPFSDRMMTWKIEELKTNYNKRTKIEELIKFLASKTN